MLFTGADFAVNVSFQGLASGFLGNGIFAKAAGLDTLAVGKYDFGTLDVFHDAIIFIGVAVSCGGSDEATNRFIFVGFDWKS